MKIVLVADYYEDYLRDFHAKHAAAVADLSYAEHMDFLARDLFGFFPAYRNHFRRIGREAELLVLNYYPLQQKWLSERGISLTAGLENKRRVGLLQLEEIRPDVFFMASVWDYYGEFIEAVSRITPNILAWICCPLPAKLEFGPVKCVLTATEKLRPVFHSRGMKSELLLPSFDPDVVEGLKRRPKTIPLSFIGSLSGEHKTRIETLEWLIRRGQPVDIWGALHFGRKDRILRWLRKPLIDRRHHGRTWGFDMYQALADSKITLNVHIDYIKRLNGGGSMRTYEALGCGALLVTDFAPEMEQMFTPGRDLVAYNSREELLEKIQYYLGHEKEAEEIAKTGQKTCLEKHSTAIRVHEFDEIIQRYFGRS